MLSWMENFGDGGVESRFVVLKLVWYVTCFFESGRAKQYRYGSDMSCFNFHSQPILRSIEKD